MNLWIPVRAGLAPALGIVLMLAPTAQAVNVNAASFLSACPGPIFVPSDTTLVGSATVTGDCTVSSSGFPGPEFNLSRATLTFTGFFKVLGNASSLTVKGSKVTAGGDLVLDSMGLMTISGSKLSAGGSANLPPRDGLEITRSSIVASGDVTVGGQGGVRNFTDSVISAGTVITIASNPSSQVSVLRSNLSAGDRITLGGGVTALSIDGSTLEAFGTGTASFDAAILIAPGGAGQWEITSSKLSAPAGSISLGGSGYFLVEDTKASSGAGILVGTGGAAGNTFRRAQFTSTLGAVSFRGSGGDVFEDSRLEADGESSGQGIEFRARFGPSITRTTVQASAGGIRFDGSGDATIIKSRLTAAGANGIFISSGNNRTITDSKLDAQQGQIQMVGGGSTEIAGSQLTADDIGGMLLSCAGNSDVNHSKLVTLGEINIPNGGGSTIVTSNLEANAGFITQTGTFNSVGSNLLDSHVTGASITVRSFFETTVENNRLNATTFEFSSTGPCTSIGNRPDVPCL